MLWEVDYVVTCIICTRGCTAQFIQKVEKRGNGVLSIADDLTIDIRKKTNISRDKVNAIKKTIDLRIESTY